MSFCSWDNHATLKQFFVLHLHILMYACCLFCGGINFTLRIVLKVLSKGGYDQNTWEQLNFFIGTAFLESFFKTAR